MAQGTVAAVHRGMLASSLSLESSRLSLLHEQEACSGPGCCGSIGWAEGLSVDPSWVHGQIAGSVPGGTQGQLSDVYLSPKII